VIENEAVYLIDANNYIFRAFHAIPAMSTPGGHPTNATYGFLRTILKLLRARHPARVAAVFDADVTFRSQIYPEYKQNRIEPPDPLRRQFKDCRRMLAAIGIPCLQAEGYEADDLIGTLADRLRAQGLRVVMVSGDKDLAQLVGEGITLLDVAREEEFDIDGVVERFGVRPEQIPDLLALHGDSIDNIPGVPGIGKKTAEALLKSYRSLEDIIKNPDRIEGLPIRNALGVKRKVLAGLESARLSRRLATIARDVPIDLDPEKLRYHGADRAAVDALFAELEFGARARAEIPRWADGQATGGRGPVAGLDGNAAPKESDPAGVADRGRSVR
jgi:DNA polymerase-1